jgi:hypothetical protein
MAELEIASESLADGHSRSAIGVLSQWNFLSYWLGQLVSLEGTWMQQLALSTSRALRQTGCRLQLRTSL